MWRGVDSHNSLWKSDSDYCLDAGVSETSFLQYTHHSSHGHDGHRLTSGCYFWLEAATNPNRASERVAFGMRAQRRAIMTVPTKSCRLTQCIMGGTNFESPANVFHGSWLLRPAEYCYSILIFDDPVTLIN
jgi:hypothetical protein